jgi:hypothetical protein
MPGPVAFQIGAIVRNAENETIKRMAKEIGLPEGTIIRGLIIHALNSGITAREAAEIGCEGQDVDEVVASFKKLGL